MIIVAKFVNMNIRATLYLSILSLIATGAFSAPKKTKQTTPAISVAEALEQGRHAFLKYDFETASKMYATAKKKAKGELSETLSIFEDELTKGENFIERTEKIVILDSIAVPKTDFFKHYRIPYSSGFLAGKEALPSSVDNEEASDYVFTNEGMDYKVWFQPDSAGVLKLAESNRLTDGSWQKPMELSDELNGDGNALYPFMMPDGVTLYYASDNSESLGGLDIFVATRDATDGTFLQPQNIGMPYNSPYDDYLLAIDELNGIGWWATDRNQLGDDLTIYVFQTNDIRTNYNSDETDNLPGLALLTDYKQTWGDSDYTYILQEIENIQTGPVINRKDFVFPLSNGRIYYTLDDFKTAAGRTMMKKYLDAANKLDQKKNRLTSMRKKYAKSPESPSLKSQIIALEREVEKDSDALTHIRSEVHRAENIKR